MSGTTGSPLDISQITENQVRAAGWATESTLGDLLASSEKNEDVLRKIAKHMKVDLDRVKAASDKADTTNKIMSDVKTGINRLSTARPDAGLKKTYDAMTDVNLGIERLNASTVKSSADIKRALNDSRANIDRVMNIGSARIDAALTQSSNLLLDFGNKIRETSPVFSRLTIAGGTLVGVLSLVVSQFGQMQDTMRGIFAAGGDTTLGMVGLTQAAMSAGLTVQDMARVMTKFSAVTATLGTRRMADLQVSFSRLTNRGASLLMTQDEAAEGFSQAMEIMRVGGELSGRSNDQIAARGRNLLQNFNDLATATGRNREELRRSTANLMQSTRVFGLSRAAGPRGRGPIADLMSELSGQFGEGAGSIANMVEGMFQGGAAGISDEFRDLLAIVPGFARGLEGITSGIRNGTLNPREAAQRMGEMFDNMDENAMRTLRMANPALHDFVREQQRNVQQVREARERLASMSDDDRRLAAENARSLEANQAAMNAAQTALRGISTTFYTMIAAMEPVLVPTLTALAESAVMLLNGFHSLIGAFRSAGQFLGLSEGNSNLAATVAAVAAILIGGTLLMGLARRIIGGAIGGAAGGVGRLLGGGRGDRNRAGAAGPTAGGVRNGGGGALSRMAGGIGGAAGGAAGGMLEGLASGLAALGNPRALLGVAVLAGIAGTLYIAGKAIQEFTSIDWSTMGMAITTMVGLGALAAIAGVFSAVLIPGAAAIGLIGAALIPFAAAVRLAAPAFEEIGRLFESLGRAFGGIIDTVGNNITRIMDKITEMRTAGVDAVTRQITALSSIPPGNLAEAARGIDAMAISLRNFNSNTGLLASISQALGSFFQGDPVNRLSRLSEVGVSLGESVGGIGQFTEQMRGLLAILDATNLERLTSAGNVISTLAATMRQGMGRNGIAAAESIAQGVSILLRSAQATMPVTPPAAVTPGTPVVTTDQINARAARYYDESSLQFNSMLESLTRAANLLERSNSEQQLNQMIEALNKATLLLEKSNTDDVTNTRRVVGAIEGISISRP